MATWRLCWGRPLLPLSLRRPCVWCWVARRNSASYRNLVVKCCKAMASARMKMDDIIHIYIYYLHHALRISSHFPILVGCWDLFFSCNTSQMFVAYFQSSLREWRKIWDPKPMKIFSLIGFLLPGLKGPLGRTNSGSNRERKWQVYFWGLQAAVRYPYILIPYGKLKAPLRFANKLLQYNMM